MRKRPLLFLAHNQAGIEPRQVGPIPQRSTDYGQANTCTLKAKKRVVDKASLSRQ